MGAIWRLALARDRMGRGAFRRREGSRAGMEGVGFRSLWHGRFAGQGDVAESLKHDGVACG